MDVRIQIICDEFADWSEACQKELVRDIEGRLEVGSTNSSEFDALNEVDLMSSSEIDALSAFILHHNVDSHDDPLLFEKTKRDFWALAVPYFAFDVPDGFDAVASRQLEESHHRDKWKSVELAVAGAESLEQLGKYLRSQGWLFQALEQQLEVRASSLESLKAKILKRTRILQDQEYESMFGFDQTYRQLGLRTSLAHFLEMIPKKPGRKPLEIRSLDAIRARSFAVVLRKINVALSRANLRPTSSKELTEVTFGVGSDAKQYDRASDVKWAYQHCFRAINTSESAFLNSLSRGRAWLADRGFQ